MSCFWNLGRDYLVLGRGSREGYHKGWCWGIWVRVWIWEMLGDSFGVLGGTFMTGFYPLERAGVWVWNLVRGSPFLCCESRGGYL